MSDHINGVDDMDQYIKHGLSVMTTVGYSAAEAAQLIIYVDHDLEGKGKTPENVAACADLERRLIAAAAVQ